MEKHITIVGAIHLGLGILKIFIAGFVFLLLVGIGMIIGNETAAGILLLVGSLVAIFLITMAIPAIIGGFGLLKRKPWARILLLILAVIELFCIPVGTAVGAYTLWVLVHEDTAKLFSRAKV